MNRVPNVVFLLKLNIYRNPLKTDRRIECFYICWCKHPWKGNGWSGKTTWKNVRFLLKICGPPPKLRILDTKFSWGNAKTVLMLKYFGMFFTYKNLYFHDEYFTSSITDYYTSLHRLYQGEGILAKCIWRYSLKQSIEQNLFKK